MKVVSTLFSRCAAMLLPLLLALVTGTKGSLAFPGEVPIDQPLFEYDGRFCGHGGSKVSSEVNVWTNDTSHYTYLAYGAEDPSNKCQGCPTIASKQNGVYLLNTDNSKTQNDPHICDCVSNGIARDSGLNAAVKIYLMADKVVAITRDGRFVQYDHTYEDRCPVLVSE